MCWTPNWVAHKKKFVPINFYFLKNSNIFFFHLIILDWKIDVNWGNFWWYNECYSNRIIGIWGLKLSVRVSTGNAKTLTRKIFFFIPFGNINLLHVWIFAYKYFIYHILIVIVHLWCGCRTFWLHDTLN